MAEFKRLDREKVLDWLEHSDEKAHSPVSTAIYEGLATRIERGDFDYPDQSRCDICGRFTREPHAH